MQLSRKKQSCKKLPRPPLLHRMPPNNRKGKRKNAAVAAVAGVTGRGRTANQRREWIPILRGMMEMMRIAARRILHPSSQHANRQLRRLPRPLPKPLRQLQHPKNAVPGGQQNAQPRQPSQPAEHRRSCLPSQPNPHPKPHPSQPPRKPRQFRKNGAQPAKQLLRQPRLHLRLNQPQLLRRRLLLPNQPNPKKLLQAGKKHRPQRPMQAPKVR